MIKKDEIENSLNNKKKNRKGISLFITYAGISIILLFTLFVIYGLNQIRLEKSEMYSLIEHQGNALVQCLEIAWQNAIVSDTLVRNLLAERLFDNAYLIDQLLGLSFDNPLFFKLLVKDMQSFHVIVTDPIGRPILDSRASPASPPLPIKNMSDDFSDIFKMINSILYGREKKIAIGLEPKNPFKDAQLWIAVARRGRPGVIIISVEAEYIDNFKSKIGLSKILEEIGSQPGIEYLVYEDRNSNTLIQKGKSGRPIQSMPFYKDQALYEFSKSSTGKDVLEIKHPLSYRGKNIGLIRIGLPLSKLKETEKAMISQTLWFGSLIIILGILGILIIFYYLYRQYQFQKTLEKDLQKADKLLSIGRLAAGVAHEIRNPLNAISMAIQRLQNEFLPPSEYEKRDFLSFTGIIKDEIKRMDKIITEFLNFTKKSLPVKSPISLSELLDNLLTVLEVEAEKNNVIFEKAYSNKDNKDKMKIWCDPDQLKQCLINIIRNAIQAMPEGGKVSISVQFTQNEVMITISDTGLGLNPSQIEKIFEFYYTNKEGGIGLGLPISQKIIEDHGGKIEVKSEAGKGANFIIHLPNNNRLNEEPITCINPV